MPILTLSQALLLLGVVFTIPAHAFSWDWLQLTTLAALVMAGMILSMVTTA